MKVVSVQLLSILKNDFSARDYYTSPNSNPLIALCETVNFGKT